MKSVIPLLLRPTKRVLIFYSLILIPIIACGLFLLSFSWIPTFEMYVIALLALGSVCFLITQVVDVKYKTRLRKYFSIACYLLFGLAIISYPLRSYYEKKSEQLGLSIIKRLEIYKKESGTYPTSIHLTFFDGLPKVTPMGTKFIYELHNNGNNYDLEFYSFGGFSASYNHSSKSWEYQD